jgi:hypothetical protein
MLAPLAVWRAAELGFHELCFVLAARLQLERDADRGVFSLRFAAPAPVPVQITRSMHMLVTRRRYMRFRYTVVFFQQTLRWWLAEELDRRRAGAATRVAAAWRGHACRASYASLRAFARALQTFWRSLAARRKARAVRAHYRGKAVAGRTVTTGLAAALRGSRCRACVEGRLVFTIVQGQRLNKPYVCACGTAEAFNVVMRVSLGFNTRKMLPPV